MKYLIIATLTFSFINFAQAKSCSSLESCVQLVSKMTKKKYLYSKDLKGAVKLTKNFKITSENADDFISEALNYNGYTRVPTKEDQWTIINARDVRYMPTKNYIYGKDQIPTNFDYIMVTIQLKNTDLAPALSRSFRPFMSRYGRIIDAKATGTLIISDTAKNAHRLIGLVNTLDKKPSSEDLERMEKDKKARQKLQMLRASKCSDIKGDLQEIKAMLYKK